MKACMCIFCKEEKQPSHEHVIPGSLGGMLVVENICADCNSVLGSAVDSELNKHRQIYDAYVKIKDRIKGELKFHFQESYFAHPDGSKVKASKTNVNRKIVPTRQERDGSFIVDQSDKNWVVHNIRKRAEEIHLREYAIEQIIRKYLFFVENAEPGDVFRDRTTGIRIVYSQENATPVNTMSVNTPHRFIAKACVEVAHLFGIQDDIVELDALRMHARYGGELEDFEFKMDTHTSEPEVGHTIVFTEEQFSVQFFAHFAVGLNIKWKGPPKIRALVNHLVEKQVYEGEIDGDVIKFIKEPFIKRIP